MPSVPVPANLIPSSAKTKSSLSFREWFSGTNVLTTSAVWVDFSSRTTSLSARMDSSCSRRCPVSFSESSERSHHRDNRSRAGPYPRYRRKRIRVKRGGGDRICPRRELHGAPPRRSCPPQDDGAGRGDRNNVLDPGQSHN